MLLHKNNGLLNPIKEFLLKKTQKTNLKFVDGALLQLRLKILSHNDLSRDFFKAKFILYG